jgi:hypothetical protein
MFKFLVKYVDFSWDLHCQNAFKVLKEKLSTTIILRGPNYSLYFHICTNSSDIALEVFLGKKENQLSYAIYFISKNLTQAEFNYIVTGKEFLVVVYAINKFRHYIESYKVFIHTDHSSIRFLMNKPITNDRITRWLLLLQEFNITIVVRLGKENLVENFFFWIHNESENRPIDDSFLNEYQFFFSNNSPWLANIANYLFAGKFLQHLSS